MCFVKHAREMDNIDSYVTWIEENPLLIESIVTHDVLNLTCS